MKISFYEAQRQLIKEVYGEREADRANYGWVTGRSSYTTKVYTQRGPAFVDSWIDEDGEIAHNYTKPN